ncbi:MAG TPA: DUF5606 domain-containing protein [Chitinophagaceae bacterium]|jgi:hypothetical protein|nr:DUF5606 domain-containing protein [Chitinophagaceae bacterium]
MEYNRIVAVTGIPGLFEILSSKTDGALVRSLDDQSTKFVSSRVHNLSHLESIEVYTVRDNVNLAEVFAAMEQSGEAAPDVKDNKALKGYFEKVFPDLDFDRVYASDMKKMVKWFEVLKKNNVEIRVGQAEEEEEATITDAEEAPGGEPVAAAPAEGPEAADEAAPAPKKRAPRKKKSEGEAE